MGWDGSTMMSGVEWSGVDALHCTCSCSCLAEGVPDAEVWLGMYTNSSTVLYCISGSPVLYYTI